MMPFSDPRFPGDVKASHFQLVLRRRPDGKLPELDADVREEISRVIAYLETLRTKLKEGKPRPLPTSHLTLPEQRDFRTKRLAAACVRLGSKLGEGASLSVEDSLQDLALLTDSQLLAGSTAPGKPDNAKPALLPARKPTPAAVPTRRARWRFALAGTVLLTVLGSTAFYLTRPAAALREEDRPAATAQNPGAAISAETLKTAEPVLRSIQSGNLEEATGLLHDAYKKGLPLPGLRYQAALLALRQGDVRTSMELVTQSIAARESVPECLYLRANSAATSGYYSTVCVSFEEAAKYTPFSPRYFFFWGEASRRYGHASEALPQFERALLCRPNSTDTDLIRFKMGLARIEAGADEKFNAYLQSLLAQKPVSGDALLLAAAVEINRAAYPAAADYLRQAKQAMPPELLDARLRDFLFQSRAQQPDLAAVWLKASPAGPVDPAAPARPRVVVIDPSTRSLTEADPAVW